MLFRGVEDDVTGLISISDDHVLKIPTPPFIFTGLGLHETLRNVCDISAVSLCVRLFSRSDRGPRRHPLGHQVPRPAEQPHY